MEESNNVTLTREEFKEISDMLWKARCDIWQHVRVAEYNLSGKDPNFPGDKPADARRIPTFIHRAGVDESYAVCRDVSSLLKRMHEKTNSKTESMDDNVTQSPPQGLLAALEAIPKRPGSKQIWSLHIQHSNSILREKHEVGCECSYCRGFAAKGRFGVKLPESKSHNSWRILWWRWKGELQLVRWTLPPKNVRGPWA